jgi:hypothetical protein
MCSPSNGTALSSIGIPTTAANSTPDAMQLPSGDGVCYLEVGAVPLRTPRRRRPGCHDRRHAGPDVRMTLARGLIPKSAQ